MSRSPGFWLSGVLLLAGCAPEFDPPSEIQSLRVLAVQKDKPYARPGDTVTLRMLVAEDPDVERRSIQVLWLAGCENPAGDLYAGCFSDISEGTMAPAVQTGEGFEFSFTLSDDIISRRPPPADERQPPYGLAYVFFAACAGTIEPLPPEQAGGFPLACMRNGRRLGPDSFVAGYTSVFAYEGFENENPIIRGFEIDGRRVVPECVNEACIDLQRREFGDPDAPPPDGPGAPDAGADGGAPDAGMDGGAPDGGVIDGGMPGGAVDGGADAADGGADGGTSGPTVSVDPCDPPGPACIPRCAQRGDCTEHDIKLLVDPDSAEIDEVARARRGERLFEQMWINYYVDRGSVGSDVRLLSDATLGFQADHGTTLEAPREPGSFHIWAVAHDNRGGASWVRVKVGAR